MSIIPARVHFEQAGSRLTAVEIVRNTRSPLIGSLHRALVTLGIVVSSYQARAGASEITERIVMERRDGGNIEAQLSDATKAAILRIAVDGEGTGEAARTGPGGVHPGGVNPGGVSPEHNTPLPAASSSRAV